VDTGIDSRISSSDFTTSGKGWVDYKRFNDNDWASSGDN
jgi:hypothetical protein